MSNLLRLEAAISRHRETYHRIERLLGMSPSQQGLRDVSATLHIGREAVDDPDFVLPLIALDYSIRVIEVDDSGATVVITTTSEISFDSR
ncbi:MAG: hypothetical protein GY906_04870 [bacterium]|nr:hypothetical protein [bacterium]